MEQKQTIKILITLLELINGGWKPWDSCIALAQVVSRYCEATPNQQNPQQIWILCDSSNMDLLNTNQSHDTTFPSFWSFSICLFRNKKKLETTVRTRAPHREDTIQQSAVGADGNSLREETQDHLATRGLLAMPCNQIEAIYDTVSYLCMVHSPTLTNHIWPSYVNSWCKAAGALQLLLATKLRQTAAPRSTTDPKARVAAAFQAPVVSSAFTSDFTSDFHVYLSNQVSSSAKGTKHYKFSISASAATFPETTPIADPPSACLKTPFPRCGKMRLSSAR